MDIMSNEELTKINEYGYIYYLDKMGNTWYDCNECGKFIPEREFSRCDGMCVECYKQDLDNLIEELEDDKY
jgi:hypothetical protein